MFRSTNSFSVDCLTALREDRDIGQKEIAAVLGCQQSAISTANASTESVGGDILCAANGLSMGGIAAGVRQRQHGTQNVPKMVGSGIF